LTEKLPALIIGQVFLNMAKRTQSDQIQLPTGITTKKGWFISFEKIHEMFAKTNYGYILKHRIRWNMFKPTEYSGYEWERTLGPDANNLDHLLVAYEQTKDFLKNEGRFTKKEQEQLLFTSIVHDWAEPAVGDIMRYVKTKQDDERELKLLKNVLHEVLGQDVDPSTIQKTCDILRNKDSKLGRAFNTIETIGYFETAFRAWGQSKKVNGDMKMRLKWLTSNVLLVDISKLIERARQYKSADILLNKYNNVIQDAFTTMPDSAFKFHRHNKIEHYQKLFEKQKKLWLRYNK